MRISDDSDCTIEEDFQVAYKLKAQKPEFIISSNTFVSDTIIIIDISAVQAEKYEWSSSDGVTIVPPTGDTIKGPDDKFYPTGRVIKMIAPEEGVFKITQTSIKEGCFVSVEKEIKVTFKDPDVENPHSLTKEITSLTVYPSPITKGDEGTIRFSTTNKEEVFVSLVDLTGSVFFEEIYSGKKRYTLSLSTIELPKAIYVLKLRTATTVLTARILIQ